MEKLNFVPLFFNKNQSALANANRATSEKTKSFTFVKSFSGLMIFICGEVGCSVYGNARFSLMMDKAYWQSQSRLFRNFLYDGHGRGLFKCWEVARIAYGNTALL